MAVSAYVVSISSYFFVLILFFACFLAEACFVFACRSRLVAPAGEFLFVRDKKEPKSASATLVRRNSLRACSASLKQPPEI